MNRVRKRLLVGLCREVPFVPFAYKDKQRKFAHIGRAICIDSRSDDGFITKEEADILMNGKLDRIEDRLREDLPVLFEMTEARQAVVLDLAYVLGVARLLDDRMFIDLLRNRRYLDLSDHVLAMAWDPDHPHRAPRLAAQMASGHWPEELLTQHHDF